VLTRLHRQQEATFVAVSEREQSLDARPSKPFINGRRETVHKSHFMHYSQKMNASRLTLSVENASAARNFGASLDQSVDFLPIGTT
jgi:hypothetical protein